MSLQPRILWFLVALTGFCGGHNEVRTVEQPSLETIDKPAASGTGMGANAVPGFLRACQLEPAGSGVVEMDCGEYRVVEFRAARGQEGEEADLDALIDLLTTRFGALQEERSTASIDGIAIRVADFQSESGLSGMGVVISNDTAFWALACYRSKGPVSRDFCGDAIATAARAQGLKHTEARSQEAFGGGALVVGDDCSANPGRGISCATGKLSWSGIEEDPVGLRTKTAANLEKMAKSEQVRFQSRSRDCSLLGKAADCQWVTIRNPAKGEELHFVLALPSAEPRLVICTFPAPQDGHLPAPCQQAIEIDLR